MSPLLGNVMFASSQSDWSFTLQSWAKVYAEQYGMLSSTFLPARSRSITLKRM